MRRLNDVELNARIHKFLYRKFSEHPELNDDEEQTLATSHALKAEVPTQRPGVL